MPLIETKGAASAQGFGEFAKTGPANYIEEVFSTWLYTGNSSTQTITNGIDLSTKGGLVWTKSRQDSSLYHVLSDSATGPNNILRTNSTAAAFTYTSVGWSVPVFNTNGYTTSDSGYVSQSVTNLNQFVSWTFRKQPKFFDVVTYTGNGATSRNISHSLGSDPGCIIVKRTSGASSNWSVYHRSTGTGKRLILNQTSAVLTDADWFASVTSTTFSVSGNTDANDNGETYVAYLFAHNAGGFGLTGTDNVISCGSYTGTGAAGNTITLGYEPQWLLIKNIDGSIGVGTSSWLLLDNMRGMTVSSAVDPYLLANTSGAEDSQGGADIVSPTATGFTLNSGVFLANQSGANYIYIAIRRGPMKTPTTGTSVFDPEAYTGTSATRTITSGFPVDLSISKIRSQGFPGGWFDRLRGALQVIRSSSTDPEATSADSLTGFDSMTGVVLGGGGGGRINTSPDTYAMWNFRRAPGFMDEVCYTGTGSSATSYSHNLGVAPELIINKVRSASGSNWIATFNFTSTNYVLAALNLTIAGGTFLYTDGASIEARPTSTAMRFTGGVSAVNDSGQTYVAYLFASCPGVSKVGSYTGTGALQTINCGFTGGARFVLIKRTDSTGDWWVYDSARGITSGNDPYLFLNSTAAEVTNTNYVDTTSVGFQVTAAAPAGLNANGGTFVFLAIS